MEYEAHQSRTGRPWLGPRKRLPVRLSHDLAAAAQAEADRRGTTFNDLVAELLAQAIEAQEAAEKVRT